MSAICLVDTSIFCELLKVPNKYEDHEGFRSELAEKIGLKETLILPMTTILETGNHIGQQGDGTLRRKTATRFVSQVKQALRGETPFTPTPLFSDQGLLDLLDAFPDWAKQGKGFGDLTIVKEWERLCEVHPNRRVYIWSKDGDLQGYDNDP